MKKNISINISGIIFHIEEDGYDQLKEYLESINRYFSTFEDSLEIIADIETRIAEIFLSKLKDGKQVIAIEDVEALVATMGSIKDFQAAEEDTSFKESQSESEDDEKDQGEPIFSKRLYRDNNRKLLAGVLSGVAFYFNIDPLWMRLLYVLLFFGVWILPSIAGFLFIAYIVMWIAVPASDELVEEKKIKKMYRDPDSKVLGGVASGIAAYFGVDVVIIRLLFFATIFIAGTGLILYIILWIILPEAKTLTDKMEMQGQPVTLSNIESNIKKSLNVTEGDENVIVKILLFPFRLIAAIFEFLSRALGPFMSFLVEALRVVFGVLLAIIGISGVLGVLIAAGVLVGLIAGGDLNIMYPLPFEIIKNDLAVLPGIALAMALIIPFFYLAILGFIVLMKKQVLNSKAGWSILALWLISIVVLSFTIPPYIRNFQENGRHISVNRYPLMDKTAVFNFNDIGEDEFDLVSLRIRSYEDTVIKLEREFHASGSTRKEAVENAKLINYSVAVQDSVFTFDSSLEFGKGTGFRRQSVDLTLYLPMGQRFILDENMRYLLGSFMYREGYSNNQMAGNVWEFQDEGLMCITCPQDKSGYSDRDESWDISGYQRTYELDGFSELEVNSTFMVNVKYGDEYSFVLNGRREDVDKVVVEKNGNTLSIDFKGDVVRLKRQRRDINVYVTMPSLTSIQLGSASKGFINGFNEEFLDVSLNGAAFAEIDVQVNSLNAVVEGASKLEVEGSGDRFEVEVHGASTLNAYDFEVSDTEVETHNASTARVYARDRLTVRSYGASNVVYKGDAAVDIEKGGGSSVRKD
ncbi:MAG: PspC domain-containing protein [Cytophagales bacterium]|nr:PspC domain-containing protein [Cytophagales bacterium]